MPYLLLIISIAICLAGYPPEGVSGFYAVVTAIALLAFSLVDFTAIRARVRARLSFRDDAAERLGLKQYVPELPRFFPLRFRHFCALGLLGLLAWFSTDSLQWVAIVSIVVLVVYGSVLVWRYVVDRRAVPAAPATTDAPAADNPKKSKLLERLLVTIAALVLVGLFTIASVGILFLAVAFVLGLVAVIIRFGDKLYKENENARVGVPDGPAPPPIPDLPDRPEITLPEDARMHLANTCDIPLLPRNFDLFDSTYGADGDFFFCKIAGAAYHCSAKDVGAHFGTIIPDRDNPHDRNALSVCSYNNCASFLGFVPANQTLDLRVWSKGMSVYFVGFVKEGDRSPYYGRMAIMRAQFPELALVRLLDYVRLLVWRFGPRYVPDLFRDVLSDSGRDLDSSDGILDTIDAIIKQHNRKPDTTDEKLH